MNITIESFRAIVEDICLGLRPAFSSFGLAEVMLYLVVSGSFVGCSRGSSSTAPPAADPNLSLASGSLNPSSAIAGGAGFTLTVTGTKFISSSSVQWNRIARATTFVSSTQLQAAITGADIANAGTAMVAVSTPGPGGGSTVALHFTIDNPVPTVASLNPNSIIVGSAGFTLTVNGTNSVSPSTMRFNGNHLPTSFVSSSQLQASIPAADIAAATSANTGDRKLAINSVQSPSRTGRKRFFGRDHRGLPGSGYGPS